MLAARAIASLFRSAAPDAPEDARAIAGAFLLVRALGLSSGADDGR